MTDDQDHEAWARARLGQVLLGKYRLDAILGIGGMGVVYRATHRNKAEFAVKMLHPDLGLRASVRARFLREGYAANSVRHGGAVRVVDDDVTEAGEPFLVMDLLEGASADHLLERLEGGLSPRVVAAIGSQLLEVLGAAHASGVVHRDIKPANVFLTTDGSVKVLDFGIARALDAPGDGPELTGAGVAIGTPSFMAPEQASGHAGEVDAQTDVWAAGATLFALLAGRPVHVGESGALVLAAAASAAARPIAEVAPGVPAPLAAVVDRALRFEKAERWAGAAQMREALEEACVAAGVSRDRAVLAALFAAPPTALPSAHPAAFAPTIASVPSLPGGGASREVTAPAVASTRHGAARRRRPGARIALATAAVLLAAAGGAWRLRPAWLPREVSPGPAPSATAPAAGTPCQILVLGIENRTAEPTLDGTAERVLVRALGRSDVLRSVAPNGLRALARELDAGGAHLDEDLGRRLLARDGGRVVTVRGVVSQQGGGFTLSIVATDVATGALVLTSGRDAADAASVVPAIGRLACALRAALGDTPPSDPSLEEQTSLSRSLEADQEHFMAVALLDQGQYESAVDHARHAVAIDPSFGLARWQLAVALLDLGRGAEARHEYQLAVEASGGLSDFERVEVEAGYLRAIGSHYRAIAPLEEGLRRRPGNFYLQTVLTGEYEQIHRIDRALELARQCASAHPGQVIALSNLAGVEVEAGNFDRAVEAGQKALRDFTSRPPHAYVYLAVAEALRGRGAEATGPYHELEARDAELARRGLVDLALAEGRLADAEALVRGAADGPLPDAGPEATGALRALLGELLLRRGDRARALAAVRAAAASASEASTLYSAATVVLAAGDAQGARAIAAALEATLDDTARTYARLLDGERLRTSHQADAALAKLKEATDIGDSWLGHMVLARTYLDRGDAALAERELRVCSARRGEAALALGDDAPSVRFVPPITYYLARALEAQGRPEARDTYRAFLALLPPGAQDPLADDARQRLGRPQ